LIPGKNPTSTLILQKKDSTSNDPWGKKISPLILQEAPTFPTLFRKMLYINP
jgi:hypothetical protein